MCAACKTSLRFEDAVVHHVLPLKDFGSAANKPENFKLLQQQISGLVEQLTKIQNFYANQLVPSLRSTIQEQANYISDLLKQFGQDQGGKNG
jgi:hypothetical protein